MDRNVASSTIVSFDLGGTLFRGHRPGFCTSLCKSLGLTVDEIRPQLERHFLTANTDMLEQIRAFEAETGLTVDASLLIRGASDEPSLFDDVLTTLHKLKQRNYTMVALSNCTPWEAGGLRTLGLASYFSHVFYSFDLGYAKPNPEAFRAVEAALQVTPRQLLHVGDSHVADAIGAKRCGWHAIHLDRGTTPDTRIESQDIARIRSLTCLPSMLDRITW